MRTPIEVRLTQAAEVIITLFLAQARLYAAPFRGPIHKVLHLMPVLPKDFHELRSAEIFGVLPKERFQAPAQVRAIPRMHSVTARHNPVVRQ